MEAIYSISINQGRSFSCRIPKRKSRGFLRSAFGFHSTNEAAAKWSNIKPEIATGDWCDLDGYLDIELDRYYWDEGYKEGIKELTESLSKVFPHITKWTEVPLAMIFVIEPKTETKSKGK